LPVACCPLRKRNGRAKKNWLGNGLPFTYGLVARNAQGVALR